MASRAFLITVIVVVAAAVTPALAADYMVGDNAGWNLGVNFTTWAAGKDFRVGDTIMFMYTPGTHNVLKVNGADFNQCVSSNASAVPLTSGNDVIALSTPGKKWYICDVADHCSKGMKLVITVSAAEGPIPAPVPGSPALTPPATSAAGGVSPLKSCVWMVAVMAAYKIIMA
ncbi:UNVERIFIED_CONTAM: Lamin-like protein [Sesamum radiatum]|uniref:Lamin-like protein n=1 Tax=Sesamum radiatum TaxID=300843 RepID=A0AAW2JPP1_SESRA